MGKWLPSHVKYANLCLDTCHYNFVLLILTGFVSIPHTQFIDMLAYKCELTGIETFLAEESFISKTSFLDLEPVKDTTPIGQALCCGYSHTRVDEPSYS